MYIENKPSSITTYVYPENAFDLANLDHSRILWFAIFVILIAVGIFIFMVCNREIK